MPIASAFLLDERSQLRRSHKQERVLSSDALRASLDNTEKKACERCRRERAGVWRGWHRL